MKARAGRYFDYIAAALTCCLLLLCAAHCEPLKGVAAPRISVDKNKFNFGKVKEGIEVRHVFKVRNQGNALLKIVKVVTSCGCTVPKMTVQSLPPGGVADLEVVMNTSLKMGSVTKEIDILCNDPVNPKYSVFVSANVDDLHKALSSAERGKLFKGKCGTCHWQKGFGFEGELLFKEDCGMCHGERAQGAIGPALAPRDYSDPEVYKHVLQVTSYGSKHHPSMPGFLVEAGGPLTEKEIDSIVKYLAEISSKKKTNQTE